MKWEQQQGRQSRNVRTCKQKWAVSAAAGGGGQQGAPGWSSEKAWVVGQARQLARERGAQGRTMAHAMAGCLAAWLGSTEEVFQSSAMACAHSLPLKVAPSMLAR